MPNKVTEWIGGQLFDVGQALLERARIFGRTHTKREQRDQLEEWNRVHIPLMSGTCAVCGKPDATDTEHCGGPLKPWKAKR